MASLRLIHIADVHLDAPFRWLGTRGREQRAQLKATFRAIVDLALAERVDAFLVAGDLFDSNSPSHDTVDLVRAQLDRLGVPIFLLPGTHDCLDDNSIYRKAHLAGSGGESVHVFDGNRTAFELSGLGLTVHGRANLTKTSRASPLDGLRKNPDTRYNVALAHGSLAMLGAEDDFPVAPGDIRGSGMDYVALGHWHSCRDCSAGPTRAFYSGPPELLGEGEQGCVLLVELAEAGARVERRHVGRRRHDRLELALDTIRSVEEIRERICGRRDPDLILSVALSGLRPLGLVVDPAELSRELSEGFFALRVDDRSHPSLSADDLSAFPEKLVIGQFVRRMSGLISEAATPEERRVREAALQVGVALLQGKRVL